MKVLNIIQYKVNDQFKSLITTTLSRITHNQAIAIVHLISIDAILLSIDSDIIQG